MKLTSAVVDLTRDLSSPAAGAIAGLAWGRSGRLKGRKAWKATRAKLSSSNQQRIPMCVLCGAANHARDSDSWYRFSEL